MKFEANGVVIRCVAGVFTILIGAFLNWLFLPAWNIRSGDFWCYCIILGFIAIMAFSVADKIAGDNITIITKNLKVVWGVIVIISIIGFITSWKIFNAVRYSNLIEIEKGNFEEEIQSISTVEEAKNFPLLDVETAQKLGNRSLSEINKVSQFEVNEEYNLINYHGKQYRLSPLEYNLIFKAMNNESIPGYVLVDSKTQESHLVQLEKQIKYAPSDIFSQDLTRLLRSKYPSYIFDKYQFDIDDNGKAYYIAPVLKPTIGFFGGKIVQSFVIVNANSGECKEYLPENLPEWVDHAYSLDYLMELAEDYYKYKGGFLNTVLSKTNVKKISYSAKGENINEDDEEDENEFRGYNSISTKNGVQFFTCVTSANKDKSAIGFILANSKTGKITYYNCVGAEESTAQLQAESLYQNFGYKSSYPLMVSVDGVPTYVISLKDKSKINKAYVMINVENYTISVGGETLESALLEYRKKVFGEEGLTPNDFTGETSNEVETKTTTGTITELYQATQNGTTQFFFVLNNDDNLYISSISNNSRQIQMSVGSKVSIDYTLSQKEEKIAIVSKIKIN